MPSGDDKTKREMPKHGAAVAAFEAIKRTRAKFIARPDKALLSAEAEYARLALTTRPGDHNCEEFDTARVAYEQAIVGYFRSLHERDVRKAKTSLDEDAQKKIDAAAQESAAHAFAAIENQVKAGAAVRSWSAHHNRTGDHGWSTGIH